jgi:GH25 family lysozyme M1 (1,4-beta-N-acetylmuramidase)
LEHLKGGPPALMPALRLSPAASSRGITDRRNLVAVVALALVAALLLTAVTAIAPSSALASTTRLTACNAVSLRTGPRTTARRVARLPKGTKVVTVAVVKGGRWHTKCTGDKSSRKWYRISRVNGKSVSKLYGVRYVYIATSLLKLQKVPLTVACDGARLRTKASTSGATKVKLKLGTKVTANQLVSGGSWSSSCSGPKVSDNRWFKITAIGSRSVQSLYGVGSLYGARSLFTSGTVSTPAPTPTPTPTPKPTPTPTPSPDPPSPYIEGIDVSHWQNTIDWKQVAAAGKQFAFIKASESTDFVDNMYATNRAQAEANGILVGAYHFARPCAVPVVSGHCDVPSDPVAEADHFIDTAAWSSGELLPVLDLETTGGLSVADLQVWVAAFLDRINEQTGVKAMIYVSPSFWSSKMGNTTQFAVNGYKILWVAHWTTADQPTVPAANWNGNGWTFWQYTSSGTVPGISGRVDLDRYRLNNFNPVTIK